MIGLGTPVRVETRRLEPPRVGATPLKGLADR